MMVGSQFVFSSNGLSLGVLTDLGCITPSVVQAFQGINTLLLECNHDSDMLRDGPYPPALQARVGGNLGHLNNIQAMNFLQQINFEKLDHLVLGHLSEKNNHPEKVIACIEEYVPALIDRFDILAQDEVSQWFL